MAWCPPTWEAAGAAHRGKDGRLHLDVADAGRMGCPQVLLLVLLRVAAQSAVQAALSWGHKEGAHADAAVLPTRTQGCFRPRPLQPTSREPGPPAPKQAVQLVGKHW